MEFRATDADGFHQVAQDAEMVVILITRQEIETLRVASAVERLTMLSESAEHVRRFAGRVGIQVSGYDDDPRPLVMIPECVNYFRALNVQWNHWFHFLVPDAELLKLILLMLVDVQVHASQRERVGYAIGDLSRLHAVLDELFGAMDQLHERFGVPAADGELTKAIIRQAISIDSIV